MTLLFRMLAVRAYASVRLFSLPLPDDCADSLTQRFGVSGLSADAGLLEAPRDVLTLSHLILHANALLELAFSESLASSHLASHLAAVLRVNGRTDVNKLLLDHKRFWHVVSCPYHILDSDSRSDASTRTSGCGAERTRFVLGGMIQTGSRHTVRSRHSCSIQNLKKHLRCCHRRFR